MRRLIAAAALATLAASGVSAQSIIVSGFTGNFLVEYCDGTRAAPTICKAYIIGVADTLALKNGICRPNGATDDQVVAIVTAYLKKRPADWHIHAAFITRNALTEAFPCQRAIRK
jgi:hypothetical protein